MEKADNPLFELLDEVHATIRRGDLSQLARLTARMEAVESHALAASADDLAEIRRRAQRNAVTLMAARRGVKAARRRIAEVLAAARGLVTYDRAGQRIEEGSQGNLARRF